VRPPNSLRFTYAAQRGERSSRLQPPIGRPIVKALMRLPKRASGQHEATRAHWIECITDG